MSKYIRYEKSNVLMYSNNIYRYKRHWSTPYLEGFLPAVHWASQPTTPGPDPFLRLSHHFAAITFSLLFQDNIFLPILSVCVNRIFLVILLALTTQAAARAMPTATTVPKSTESSLKPNPRSRNRKPSKHQNHRYGRIRREGDEEIVRAEQSDYGESESDKTDEGDSHSESSAVSLPDSHLPSSSQSQQTPGHSNEHDSTFSDASEPNASAEKPLLNALGVPPLDWSDSVFTSEGDIPVIQFHEMGSHDDTEKDGIFDEDHNVTADGAKSHRGAPPTFRRHVGMSARQVYLKRLESDPAYTPRVGEFWSHDERLLDKDLRSLSGWWRGKWTDGARGTTPGSSGEQGRDSFSSPVRGGVPWKGRNGRAAQQANVDPVDQAWKHDGFEEMKKVEEIQEARSRAASDAANRSGSWAGRGRSRGGGVRGSPHLGRAVRSNSITSPSTQPSQGAPRSYGHVRAQSATWNRYEHAWTKHAVTFLFQDALSRPKNGDEVGIRVKLPGQHRFNVVRLPKSSTSDASSAADNVASQTPPRVIVVKLPRAAKHLTDEQATAPENACTVATPPIPEEDVSTAPTISLPTAAAPSPVDKAVPAATGEVSTADTAPLAQQSESPEPPSVEQPAQPQPRDLPPTLQIVTNFPEPAASPAYASPSFAPGYYHPVPRPPATYPAPGMMNNEQPVWYDPHMPYGYPTPPLPGHHMYTPPQAARHVHHSHSLSHPHPHVLPQPSGAPYYGQQPVPVQEFHQPPPVDYSQPATSQSEPRPQPVFTYSADGAMIDVHTGTPIFSLAKSAVKVAIRRPGGTDKASFQQQQTGSAQQKRRRESKLNEDHETNTRNEAPASVNPVPYQQQPHPEMAIPPQGFVPGHVHGHPSQQFWNGYPQPPNGYYYQQPMYGVPQPQEYGYGQPMQGPPMHGYPTPQYGDSMEYQPNLYY